MKIKSVSTIDQRRAYVVTEDGQLFYGTEMNSDKPSYKPLRRPQEPTIVAAVVMEVEPPEGAQPPKPVSKKKKAAAKKADPRASDETPDANS